MKLLVEKSRLKLGKNEQPSYSIIDSQSVKTTGPCEEKGIDGEKLVKGRKRHIVTDTAGHLFFM
jgi:putative transposase